LNALIALIAAKENCFHEPFKTVKTVRISKFIRLSGRRSVMPDSRMCWVNSEAQWDGSRDLFSGFQP